MDRFLRQAEEILDVASEADGSSADLLILIDRQGGLRMMEAAGWSADGLRAEFGATAFYRVEQRAHAVHVEGWQGSQSCLMRRSRTQITLSDLPGVAATGYATMLQLAGPEPACSKERSPQVRNS